MTTTALILVNDELRLLEPYEKKVEIRVAWELCTFMRRKLRCEGKLTDAIDAWIVFKYFADNVVHNFAVEV